MESTNTKFDTQESTNQAFSKKPSTLLLTRAIFAVALLLPISAIAQQAKVSAKLWQEVRSVGTVRVLVLFDMRQEFFGNLSKEDQIAAAQDMLLAELSGTKFRVTGRFRYVTGLGLFVDAEGLSILERSALVDRIDEDLPHRLQSRAGFVKNLTTPAASSYPGE